MNGETETLFEDRHGRLAVRRHNALSREMLDLATAAVWGSGGTRYQYRDIETKLHRAADPEFVALYAGGRLAGFYAQLGKQVTIDGAALNARYGTFLAVAPAYRGRGYGSLLAEQVKRHYLDGPGGADLVYAYVEADNLASVNSFKRAGYGSVADFRGTVFSRWRPLGDPRCRRLEPNEHAGMAARLAVLYDDHVLRDFEQSLDPGGYWVLESESGIIAGVQMETCHWRILSIPGLGGALLVHGVSRMPLLRRLFNARQCRFLKLGNLYAEPGSEACLFPLMESVLASSGLNAALIFHDPRSPVFARIRNCGRFGLLDSAIDARVHVMAAAKGLSPRQDEALRTRPVLISPMDVG